MADPPIFVDGVPATAAELQALGSEPALFTPTLSAAGGGLNLGTSPDRNGLWVQSGPLAHYWFEIQFGTGGAVNAGSGQYQLSVPVPILSGSFDRMSIGSGRANDNSVGTDLGSSILEVEMLPGDPTKVVFGTEEGVTVSATIPWTWAANDRLFGYAVYPGDF